MTQTTYADRMRAALTEAFSPETLTIEDQSEAHRGHGGYREGGETHFHISMRARAFDGVGRVARQRMVMKAVAKELEERVHALSLSLAGTDE